MSNLTNPIKVLLVDDHDIVLRGLEVSLATFDDIEVVGHARAGSEAIGRCEQLKPDVLLLDLMMPDMNGIQVIQGVRAKNLDTIIIVLTNFKEADLVQGALEAGATSYLLKNVSVDELGVAIRNAVRGRPTLAPEAAQVLITSMTRPKAIDFDLTEREIDVLYLLTRGRSNRQIADQLVISSSTVKNHVSSIIAKLSVKSRTEAATKALRLKLVDENNR
ncbi:MAG: response regulator transcription factor [Phototrophicaceae bacterium]